MNKVILKITLGLASIGFSMSASAQKIYNAGVINYSVSAPVANVDTKVYFTADSSAAISDSGIFTAKVLSDNKGSYLAILVNVPMISVKKVSVLTPAEIAQAKNDAPRFTFSATNETKKINGFNCKKVNAKDVKNGNKVELWVTNDIKTPVNSLTRPFAAAGGVPVKFVTVRQGQTVNVEMKSISAEKVQTGTFGIPPGYDKISFSDLKQFGSL